MKCRLSIIFWSFICAFWIRNFIETFSNDFKTVMNGGSAILSLVMIVLNIIEIAYTEYKTNINIRVFDKEHSNER